MLHRETPPRLCSKSSCQAIAAATLTYVYEDQEAVIGPLAIRKEPHTYDLCDAHAQRLSAACIALNVAERQGFFHNQGVFSAGFVTPLTVKL